jgi:hypothetical protein
MAAAAKSKSVVELSPIKLTQGEVTFYVVGNSPLVLNRMSEKAKHDLLMPKGRMSEQQKASNLKHNPITEYQASAYRIADPDAPTLLAVMSSAFKGAMRTAALEMPGMFKSQIGRLTYVVGDYTGVYGVPKLYMSVVRSAGMNAAPDIRTRAIIPEWAAAITVKFITPTLSAQAIMNLLASGGLVAGIGDGRVEKGSLNFGLYEVVADDDPRLLDIMATGGRDMQQLAMDEPDCYDAESAEMFGWFSDEMDRRQKLGRSAETHAKTTSRKTTVAAPEAVQ